MAAITLWIGVTSGRVRVGTFVQDADADDSVDARRSTVSAVTANHVKAPSGTRLRSRAA